MRKKRIRKKKRRDEEEEMEEMKAEQGEGKRRGNKNGKVKKGINWMET